MGDYGDGDDMNSVHCVWEWPLSTTEQEVVGYDVELGIVRYDEEQEIIRYDAEQEIVRYDIEQEVVKGDAKQEVVQSDLGQTGSCEVECQWGLLK